MENRNKKVIIGIVAKHINNNQTKINKRLHWTK